MIENWKRWKEDVNLPSKLVLDSLVDDINGICLLMSDNNDRDKVVEVLFSEFVLSYRNRDESDFIDKFNYLSKNYGYEFYGNWSLFEVTSSEYIQWFYNETLGRYRNESIRHFVFITINDIVEVLATYEPEIRSRC